MTPQDQDLLICHLHQPAIMQNNLELFQIHTDEGHTYNFDFNVDISKMMPSCISIHTNGRGTHVLDISMDISKITSDGDPTKTHVTTLLEILPGRRDISVTISRSGVSYVSKRYYYIILLI